MLIHVVSLMKEMFVLQYLKDNPDYNNPAYNTKLGIYSEGCGLENVLMSWGHDDYMYLVYPLNIQIYLVNKPSYGFNIIVFHHILFHKETRIRLLPNLQVAKKNGTTLPPAALFVIRYHSFYRKH
jgi:inositol oxygenase